MKLLLKASIITAALLLQTPAFATPDKAYCEAVHRVATAIMESRQIGIPVTKMASTSKSAEVRELSDSLVLRAYAEPRYVTKSVQQDAVIDFANDAYMRCMKGQ